MANFSEHYGSLLSDITTQIACPRCNQKMILYISLTITEPLDGVIECVQCGTNFLPLVAGSIIAGPFLPFSAERTPRAD